MVQEFWLADLERICVRGRVTSVSTRMRLPQLLQHRHRWHVFVGVPLLLCVLVISGCSTRFLYNRLDTLASWYFESLVSLNDGQRSELRAWLERTLAWHRQSELTRYAEFVHDIAETVDQPATPEVHESLRVRFQGLLDSLISKTAPEASELLIHLSPHQVDELLANLAKKSAESLEESAEAVADNEWRPKQTKDLLKQLKKWTGATTPQQKQLIEATVARLEPTYEDWADSQQLWRDALRAALLQQRSSEGAISHEDVLNLLADPDQKWTAAYSAKVKRNRDLYQQLLMELDASLTREQRQHLRVELDKMANMLARLAKG